MILKGLKNYQLPDCDPQRIGWRAACRLGCACRLAPSPGGGHDEDDEGWDDGFDDNADDIAGCACRSGSSPGGGLQLSS